MLALIGSLGPTEIGIILLALQGFNSEIYPIQIGARGGRGYGHMKFVPRSIYRLERAALADWVSGAVQSFKSGEVISEAGYYALPEVDSKRQAVLLENAKTAIRNHKKGG